MRTFWAFVARFAERVQKWSSSPRISWEEGGLLFLNFYKDASGRFEIGEYDQFDRVKADADRSYELMQYTGLKDKNGKEIYEGEVVRYATIAPWNEEETLCVDAEVGFEGGQFWLYGIDGGAISDVGPLEVIGNVYDNPELLEAGDESI